MENDRIGAFADELFRAERDRVAMPPLTQSFPAITVDDAYGIQMRNVRRALEMGHGISGKKIGLTSPGIQRQLGVHEPDYGHLFAAMDCSSDGRVDTAALIQPKIEAEVAFVLGRDLAGGNVTAQDVRAATDHIMAAFEIVDSRVADWRIQLADTVADNASSGRYILGSQSFDLREVDLPNVAMRMLKNGEAAGEGVGAAVMGDPCLAVAWLANRLWGYGVRLRAGEVILSGAFSAAPLAAKGDVFVAEFTTLGSVRAEFI